MELRLRTSSHVAARAGMEESTSAAPRMIRAPTFIGRPELFVAVLMGTCSLHIDDERSSRRMERFRLAIARSGSPRLVVQDRTATDGPFGHDRPSLQFAALQSPLEAFLAASLTSPTASWAEPFALRAWCVLRLCSGARQIIVKANASPVFAYFRHHVRASGREPQRLIRAPPSIGSCSHWTFP